MTPTDEAETKPEEVVVECEMEASPQTLWRALTEEELLADWLGARPAAAEGEDAVEGPSYRIVEAEPYDRLRYAWHDPSCPDAPPMVTVELEPISGGRTWFRLTHGQVVANAPAIRAANSNCPPLARAA
ncbi:SRPBCC family protein [Chelativorans salis]|uniref:SRPBCC domain-containing protein n=1 Tax=Chelativorans salis TaxID=2978478 RepID=A0ABT2LLP0_9HYPH|nr:SRPBCC domain-containing protein [Chelativorans sp. EGI FJ00035]MCT7375500.1 SRPBCC domain-containing protein [Chelativorans sp. EGI FJ00035]